MVVVVCGGVSACVCVCVCVCVRACTRLSFGVAGCCSSVFSSSSLSLTILCILVYLSRSILHSFSFVSLCVSLLFRFCTGKCSRANSQSNCTPGIVFGDESG